MTIKIVTELGISTVTPSREETAAMNAVRRNFRRLAQAQRAVSRKLEREHKRIAREAYDWASLGY